MIATTTTKGIYHEEMFFFAQVELIMHRSGDEDEDAEPENCAAPLTCKEKVFGSDTHTSYLSRAHERGSCKFFLAGVNFYRFNAKNLQFTVYFVVITQKIGNCGLSSN